MSDSTQKGFSNDARLQDAEQTLRLIAGFPAPEGLEDRIHAGLRVAPRQARLLAWPQAISPARGWLRSAAAAAIVCVVAGGGWGIYSHVQPGQAQSAGTRGGFSAAGTERKPLTLNRPMVTRPASVATPAPVPATAVQVEAKGQKPATARKSSIPAKALSKTATSAVPSAE